MIKMDLFQCDNCENIYAVYPTPVMHSCPYCQGENHLVAEGKFIKNNND
ncbi:hypothetical protein PB1_16349 [Bacillus methanolicus PB1]|uniref:Uncharacterized protein n=1 Tax=Bacillus methanolicus PB1 TaxID=997296 RepID=I3DY24_BACMT|nr:hypothetical protein [Bacillus methanolicus]EIJ79145.1 hypothetical protein PB1_16349 [Bacillus methanolicus PB1]